MRTRDEGTRPDVVDITSYEGVKVTRNRNAYFSSIFWNGHNPFCIVVYVTWNEMKWGVLRHCMALCMPSMVRGHLGVWYEVLNDTCQSWFDRSTLRQTCSPALYHWITAAPSVRWIWLSIQWKNYQYSTVYRNGTRQKIALFWSSLDTMPSHDCSA